jgi:cytoskeletal protein RodZ
MARQDDQIRKDPSFGSSTTDVRADAMPRTDPHIDAYETAEPMQKPRRGFGLVTTLGIAVVVVLGFAFYTINSAVAPIAATETPPAATSADRSASEPSRPAVPPGVRDVTPYNNDSYRPGAASTTAGPHQKQP